MAKEYRASVVLTESEGKKLTRIFKELNIANPSQLLKRIINGKLVLVSEPEYEYLRSKYEGKDLEKEALLRKMQLLLNEYNYGSLGELKEDIDTIEHVITK